MSDKYILRSGAIDAIKRNSGTLYTREAEFLFRKVVSLLKNAPAADVAEVVRCKDCKYGDYDSKSNGAMICLRTIDGFWRKETDFCSYGERRGGGNDHVSD